MLNVVHAEVSWLRGCGEWYERWNGGTRVSQRWTLGEGIGAVEMNGPCGVKPALDESRIRIRIGDAAFGVW